MKKGNLAINKNIYLVFSHLKRSNGLHLAINDVYLPAMPTMERQLHGDAELTITGFLIGFAIAQLIWGPISDRIG